MNHEWTRWLAGHEDRMPTRTTLCIDDLGPATLFEMVLTAAMSPTGGSML